MADIISRLNNIKCPIKNKHEDILILILNKEDLNNNICSNLSQIILFLNESPVINQYKQLLEFIISKDQQEIKSILKIMSMDLYKITNEEEYISKFYEK